MQRHYFVRDGLRLSYLDSGGRGPVLIALPAHLMEGVTYAPLAAVLGPRWRVVALDQRGHGHSDHAPRRGGYTPAAYLGDLAALLDHLGIAEAVLLGNSVGGVNAYEFAAREPGRVRALVVEDIGAVVADDMTFVLEWEGWFPSRNALAERIGPVLLPYLEDAFRKAAEGWRLAFDPADVVASQRELNGDHWAAWLATDCPALLIRGRRSRVTRASLLKKMAARRIHTRLVTLDAGHIVHADNPVGFAAAVREFLESL